MSGDDVVGHKTFRNPDGSARHEALTRAEADAIWARIDAEEQRLAEEMPTEEDAIRRWHEAYCRLEALGWKDALSCPKDGSMFSALEAGSRGVHKCSCSGSYPRLQWWIYDGDAWPATPVLWRPRKETDKEVNLGPCGFVAACCADDDEGGA